MPYFDGTGPQGMGPLTGRGMGACVGGMGFRRGMGRGFRRMVGFQRPWPVADTVDNEEFLAQEEQYLKEELKAVQDEIKNLKNRK